MNENKSPSGSIPKIGFVVSLFVVAIVISSVAMGAAVATGGGVIETVPGGEVTVEVRVKTTNSEVMNVSLNSPGGFNRTDVEFFLVSGDAIEGTVARQLDANTWQVSVDDDMRLQVGATYTIDRDITPRTYTVAISRNEQHVVARQVVVQPLLHIHGVSAYRGETVTMPVENRVGGNLTVDSVPSNWTATVVNGGIKISIPSNASLGADAIRVKADGVTTVGTVIVEERPTALEAIAGEDGKVGFGDVLDAISAYNEGRSINGVHIGFEDVVDAISAYNRG